MVSTLPSTHSPDWFEPLPAGTAVWAADAIGDPLTVESPPDPHSHSR